MRLIVAREIAIQSANSARQIEGETVEIPAEDEAEEHAAA